MSGFAKNILRSYPDLPATVGAGACIVTHPTGASTEAYIILSATSFNMVDLVSGSLLRLPNPPAGLVFGAGVCMLWDPSRGASGRVYVFGPGTGAGVDAYWHHFDIATKAWDVGGAPNVAALNALLGGTWAIEASLAHPCTRVGLAVSDNFIYLTGNGGLPAFRYDITEPGGTEWTSVPPANRAVLAGPGSTLNWLFGQSVDHLYSVDGNGVGSMERYGIAGDAWAAVVPVPVWTELPTTGTCSCVSTDGRKLYIKLNATGVIYAFDAVGLTLTPVAQISESINSDGTATTATVGRKMATFKDRDADTLVVMINGTNYLQGIRLPRN